MNRDDTSQLTNLEPASTLESAVEQTNTLLEQANLAYGHGVESAEDEAFWLVLSACNEKLGQAEYQWHRVLNDQESEAVSTLVSERIRSRKPLAYLLGETWFAGFPFSIDERALVPRSFMAEWIGDRFEPWVDSNSVSSILDLCCGSGCIGIATALQFEEASLVLSDISPQALELAADNVARHNLQQRTRINHGAMFDGISEKFDLILCNPPYVSSERMARLPMEYRNEPSLALVAGDDGLDFLRPFLSQVRQYLHGNGVIIVEVGSASFAVEEEWPDVPFNWMMTEHDEMVLFAMSAAELDQFQSRFSNTPVD